jgi:hypothetical protein
MRARFSLAAFAVCCLGATSLAAPAPAVESLTCEERCDLDYQTCLFSSRGEAVCAQRLQACMANCATSGI